MKRSSSRILTVLLLAMSIPLCCLFGAPNITYEIKQIYATPPTPDSLKTVIIDAFARYESGEIPYVDLSTITPFSWDRFYVIGAFWSGSRLNSYFGISWMTCYTRTYWHDGYVFLVFTMNGKIVRCFDLPIVPYGFDSLASTHPDGIPIQEAVFISHGEDGYVEVVKRK